MNRDPYVSTVLNTSTFTLLEQNFDLCCLYFVREKSFIMRNYIGGIVICVMILGFIGFVSGKLNYNAMADRDGADKSAQKFAKSCQRTMKDAGAEFHFRTPAIASGCICLGVKIQDAGGFQSATSESWEYAYEAFVLLNKNEMNPFIRSNALSTPRKSMSYIDIPYSNKPRIKALSQDTPETKFMSKLLMKSYAYCDNYSLEGNPLVLVDRLPSHLR